MSKKLIELTQVRHGDLRIQGIALMIELVEIGRFVADPALGEAFDALEDPIGVDDLVGLLDGLLDPTYGVFNEQLQDSDELTGSTHRSVAVFELVAESAKDRR